MPARYTLLAYCDKMFTPSESFIPRGYSAFEKLHPIFIGHKINGPIPAGTDAIDLTPLHGGFGVTGFKQFGQVSDKLESSRNRAYGPG